MSFNMDQLTARLEQLEDTVKTLAEENVENRIRIRFLDQTLYEKDQDFNNQLQKQLEQSSTIVLLNTRIEQLECTVKTVVEENTIKKEENKQLTFTVSDLIKQLQKKQEQPSNMNQLTARLEQLEDTFKTFKKENIENRIRIKLLGETLSKKDEEYKKLTITVSDISNQLQIQQEEMNSLKRKMDFFQNVHATFDSRLSSSEWKAKQIEDRLQSTMKEASTLDFLLKSVAPLKDIVSRLSSEQKVLAVNQRLLKEKTDMIQSLQLEVCYLRKTLQKQEKKIQVVNDRSMKNEKLKTILQSMVLKGKDQNPKEVLDELKIRLDVLDGKIEDVKRQVLNVATETEDGKYLISVLKSSQDIVNKTAFHVNIKQSQVLKTDVLTKLDSCQQVNRRSHYFDDETGSFNVPADGIYLFTITVWQSGKGKIEVSVGALDEIQYFVVHTHVRGGWTDTKTDVRTGCIMLTLSKGQRVGAYVKRLEGEATVVLSGFGGCLLSCST